MKSWQPNMLVQDDSDVTYQPTDKNGKQLAARITMELRRIMWRAAQQVQYAPPGQTQNCRCVMRPIKPLE